MSYFLRIFGQEKQSLSTAEVTEFIHDGYFFEEEPDFDSDIKDEFTWKIKITYDKQLAPVIISSSLVDAASKKELDEIKFVLDASKASAPKERILQIIGATVISYTIEINQKELTKDAWEMLDIVEAFLMRSCNGILFTGDNEFYDVKLKKFYKL